MVQGERYVELQRKLFPPPGPTLPADIQILPGFKVDLLRSAGENEGTWIAMTFDPQGRVIVSPQQEGPLLRMTLSGRKMTKVEQIPQFVAPAMGLSYFKNSLYIECKGPKGWGVYRMRDKGGGDFAEPELLCPMHFTDFEHGAHGPILGPDGKIYVVCGDHTQLPPDISSNSPFQNYAEDQLLAQMPDPKGWDYNVWLPEGYVMRMDLDGKNREVFAGGARNNYCIAFNSDGELFGYDNDHNYDFGLPWYRPTRINHWISGADFGHRQGDGKFLGYIEDTLPATLDVGLGGAAGVAFPPANCPYPAEYKEALFAEDWQFGRLFAVHLIPHGANYDATIETILHGKPLNMSSMAFGPDGNLYFITGGLASEAGLYRLTYNGPSSLAGAKNSHELNAEKAAAQARQIRHELEAFQGRRDPRAADFLWPWLNSEDRWLRYAARIALESQDLETWRQRALAETNKYAGLTSLVALARCDGPASQPDLIAALEKFPFSELTEEQTFLKLRVMELSFIRQGHPSASVAAQAIASLDPVYPASSENVNHELCQLLLYLDAPDAIAKTLALMDKAPVLENQIYYVSRLYNISKGWTLAQRKDYLGWFLKDRSHAVRSPALLQYFNTVGQDYADGQSFELFLDNFRRIAMASLTPAERHALADYVKPLKTEAPVFSPLHKFIKAWRIEELLPHLSSVNTGRHLARGLALFSQGQCAICHRFGVLGGNFGPDLSAVGSRMSPREILESILEPSKVVADEYKNTILTLKNGDVLLGRVVGENDKNILLLTDLLHLDRQYVSKSEVVSRRISKVSPMPEELANYMTEDEIWDLVAYLKAGPRGIKTASKIKRDSLR
jgi:putative heme-binding domain-containing protein